MNDTQIVELGVRGCYEIVPPAFRDDRGVFSKPFNRVLFDEHGLLADFAETFYTVSEANVLRGMHLQLPPADHAKLVYCVAGRVLDVALDMRAGTRAYGEHVSLELSAERRNAVYLPHGAAHGFFVLEAPAIVVYQVTSVHAPALDSGIRWDSFGMAWPTTTPLVSARDAKLAPFDAGVRA